MIREIPIKVGQPIPLQGIGCVPSQPISRVGVILLNSGIMHRVGACRMTVKIARKISEDLGIFCLRFDASGIGDSEPRRSGNTDFEDTPTKEVLEVMDFCQQKYGIEKFVLYGLCSGAHISCKVGEIDERVIGIIQIDGYSYPTLKSHFLYYIKRASSSQYWLNRLKKLMGIEQKEGKPEKKVLTGENSDSNFEIPLFGDMPLKSVSEKRISTIIKKNISLHSIFTGTEPYYFYDDQYRDCFKKINFNQQLSVDYYPEASHIFTEPACQKKLIESVVNYLKTKI